MADTMKAQDAAEAVRRARFGTLPERVRLEETVQERPAAPVRQGQSGDDEESLAHFLACFAGHLA
jgi:hypothetical protein